MEQPLPPYGACLLGSINLTKFVTNPFTEQASFDWDKFTKVVEIFTRMLDNVVELNGLPLDQQRQELVNKRRHGMGYLGLGSALTMLCIPYGSKEAIGFTSEVTANLAITGYKTGISLAKIKGSAPILEAEYTITPAMIHQRPELISDGWNVGDKVKGKVLMGRYSKYIAKLGLGDEIATHGCRFSHATSIAPTGSIALSVGNNASNGIEPSFSHTYKRNVIVEGKKTKEQMDVYSYEALMYASIYGKDAPLPDYFITADHLTPEQHVDMQAAAQEWVDSSISKTCNIPTDFPFDKFKDIYLYAYRKGLKGFTTFRFNPEAFSGVLVNKSDLDNTKYQFTLEDGSVVEVSGSDTIEYDGETHVAANLFDALKEGYYGKF